MSYAGPASTTARNARRTPPAKASSAPRRNPVIATPEDGETDWQQVAIFGAGLALGIALGAGAALLTAPRTGSETRAVLRSRAGRLRRSTTRRGHDAWDDLRDELAGAARAFKRRRNRRRAEAELDLEIE